jgi:hypothetical protein
MVLVTHGVAELLCRFNVVAKPSRVLINCCRVRPTFSVFCALSLDDMDRSAIQSDPEPQPAAGSSAPLAASAGSWRVPHSWSCASQHGHGPLPPSPSLLASRYVPRLRVIRACSLSFQWTCCAPTSFICPPHILTNTPSKSFQSCRAAPQSLTKPYSVPVSS